MGCKTAIGFRIKRILAVLWIAVLLIPNLGIAQPNSLKVAVVSNASDKTHRQVSKSIANVIASSTSSTIDLSFIDFEEHAHTEDLFNLISGHDLVVTVGLSATNILASSERRPPLLATLIPLQAAKSMFPSSRQRSSAIVLDQPIERQLRLIKTIFAATKSVGILLSPSTGVSEEELNGLSKHFDLHIHTEMVTEGDNLIRELGYVLDKSDIFLAIPDPTIFNRNTAGSLLQTAYRRRIPVIGFSQSHVKAGALAAVFSTPEQIGRHTGETIVEYFTNGKAGFPAIQSPKYFSVAFNRQVERSLGLAMPKESAVEQEMRSTGKIAP